MTLELIEETLQNEVRKIDKSVQVVAVEQSKKKDFYRATLLKDGKSGSAELKKDKEKSQLTRHTEKDHPPESVEWSQMVLVLLSVRLSKAHFQTNAQTLLGTGCLTPDA